MLDVSLCRCVCRGGASLGASAGARGCVGVGVGPGAAVGAVDPLGPLLLPVMACWWLRHYDPRAAPFGRRQQRLMVAGARLAAQSRAPGHQTRPPRATHLITAGHARRRGRHWRTSGGWCCSPASLTARQPAVAALRPTYPALGVRRSAAGRSGRWRRAGVFSATVAVVSPGGRSRSGRTRYPTDRHLLLRPADSNSFLFPPGTQGGRSGGGV